MTVLFEGLESMQPHGIPRVLTQRLEARFPGRHVLVTTDGLFRTDTFAFAGLAVREPLPEEVVVDLVGGHPGDWHISRHSGLERVRWQDHELQVLRLKLPRPFEGDASWHWVIASDAKVAQDFYLAVAEWNRHVHGEVLVFEGGCFCKSKELQDDLGSFTLDDLVLAGDLGAALSADLKRFLQSREVYRRAKVPWKRGLLFLGPPGNGKTHAVKGLLRESGLPCIYVKSFSGRRVDPHDTIPKVFERARDLAPCVLVLEDLDALIDDENRSLVLNELDGFARNDGLLTIATTKHPERLDPSLLHRPSRFDRKFHFALPELQERRRYLERWALGLDTEMRPSSPALEAAAEGTSGFTFAYLKEATLSALVQWVGDHAAPRPSMDAVLTSVVESLVKEIAALPPGGAPPPPPRTRRPALPWDA
jgi:ATPase family associated with various cellular activities (AAA)